MNARSQSSRMWQRSKKTQRHQARLRGFEALENRHLMAVDLEIRLDALRLDGTTALTQIGRGQEFLLRGQAIDLRSSAEAQGAFQVYTDIGYQSAEVTPMVGEVQRLDFEGTPTGGTFTLSYNNQVTSPIAFDEFNQGSSQALAIQNALEGITALAGNVRVNEDTSTDLAGPTYRYSIRFINNLDNQDVALLVPNDSQLISDPSDPGNVTVTETAKGFRSNANAFTEAFAYNGRGNGLNTVTLQYPDNREGADSTNLFDNVGGGAPLFSPPGGGATTYFLLRARADDGGGDNLLTFINGLSNSPGLPVILFGQGTPLDASQIKFTYGTNGTNTTSLQIPVATPVRAVDDSGYAASEGSPGFILATSPLENDVQTPSTPRTLVITSTSVGSGGGSLTIVNNGQDVRYKPAENFFGTETFTYTVEDGDGGSDTGTISIQVNAVNDTPSFTKGPDILVNEDAGAKVYPGWADNVSAGPGESNQSVDFLVDVEDPTLFTTQPAISDAGTLTFTAKPNAHGTTTVSVRIKDNSGANNDTSAVQIFNITIGSINDAPVNTVSGTRNTVGTNPVRFENGTRLSVSDVDAASAEIVTTLDVNNGRLTIGGTIGAGLVVTGNNTGSVTLTGTQAEIRAAMSLVVYRANDSFFGSDLLTMVTNDQGNAGAGGAKSDTATVTINVNRPSPPTAMDDGVTIAEDSSPRTIDVLNNDAVHTGSTAVLKSFSQPASGGSVALDDNGTPGNRTDDRLVFTPARDFNGNVSFTYVMNDTDGTGTDSTGNVNVTVNPVNDAPKSIPHTFNVNEDTILSIAAPGLLSGASDVDGDSPLRVVKTSNPLHGVVTVNANGSFTYRPTKNYSGPDRFHYRVQDPSGALSTIRQVTINVAAQPDVPTAVPKTYSATEDVVLRVPASSGLLVGANDPDGDAIRAVRMSQPGKGSVVVNNDGSFVYTPNSNVNGQDTFRYRVIDSTSRASTIRTVTINIAAANDRPVANPDRGYTTSQNTNLVVDASRSVLNNDTDIDGDSLTAVLADQATNGTVTLNANGSFTYRPNSGFIGTDTFTYQARDNSGAANNTSPKTTVEIDVTAVNQAPTAQNRSYSGQEDTNLVVSAGNGLLVGANDPEGGQLTVDFVSQPLRGTLVSTNDNGSFTYRPDTNFNGVDSFTYRVSDGQLNSEVRKVTLNVAARNDAPPAVDDSYNVLSNAANQLLPDVLINDRAALNVDGSETLTIVAFTATTTQGGSVQKDSNGRFHYTPRSGFLGTDSFSYTVGDGKGGRNTAVVTLNVRAAAPSAVSGFVYRDLNSNGRRDTGEPGIGRVRVQLVGTNNSTSKSVLTSGSGAYSFAGVTQGTYRIVETQPSYIRDGEETVGSIGGTKGNDFFNLNIPQNQVRAQNYNFGELGLVVGENPNGDPPLELTLQEILASNSNFGALAALSGSQQSWFTTLDSSWQNVSSMTVQLSGDSSRVVLTVVVNSRSYVKTLFTQESEGLYFRIMATNNNGFQIIRMVGDLDLSEFSQVGSAASANDAVFASWAAK